MVLMALRWVSTDLTEKAPHDGGAEKLMKGFRKPPFSLVRSPEHDSSDHCFAALPELYTPPWKNNINTVYKYGSVLVPRHNLAPMVSDRGGGTHLIPVAMVTDDHSALGRAVSIREGWTTVSPADITFATN